MYYPFKNPYFVMFFLALMKVKMLPTGANIEKGTIKNPI